jgi:PKD repeat protein
MRVGRPKHFFAGWTMAHVLAMILISGCGGGGGSSGGGSTDGGSGGGSTPTVARQIVDNQGGSFTTSVGVALVLPAGAINTPTTLVIQPVAEALAPTLPTGTAKAGKVFSFEPHGVTFNSPVTVKVPYDPSLMPSGAVPALFKAQPGGTFAEISPVTVEGNFLVASVTSFSYFAVMARPAPPNLPPSAKMTLPGTPFRSGASLTFSSSGSLDPERQLVKLSWNFGDNTPVVVQNQPGPTTHLYTSTGSFDVSLTAEDAKGAVNTVASRITLDSTNTPPIASFVPGSTGPVLGATVNFNPSGSSDPDGSLVRFDWEFGDGTSLSRTNALPIEHVFLSAGSKQVRLTVTDNDGLSSSTTSDIQVRLNAVPVAVVTLPTTAVSGIPLTFSPTGSSDSDGFLVRYDWDMGDGTKYTRLNTDAVLAVIHQYANAGTFQVKLKVIDNDNATHTVQQALNVTSGQTGNKSPTAKIALNISSAMTGQEVVMNPSDSADSDGQIVKYQWNFGDGTTAESATPVPQVRQFTVPGLRTIRLTVTDNGGATNQTAVELSTVSFPGTGLLNDTGINWCSNLTGTTWVNNVVCSTIDWTVKLWGTVQDAWYGRDALARSGTLSKIGTGMAGFDFTRLGSDGQPLAIQNGTWSENGSPSAGTRWDCIRDNNTGLFWEVKRNDPLHLRHASHQFVWYSNNLLTNGGDSGNPIGGSCTGLANIAQCNTEAYANAVNHLPVGQALCGFRDWRVPEREELRNLAYSGKGTSPAIDTMHFPNVTAEYHWTNSPDVSNAWTAWGINFVIGDDFYDAKTTAHPVFLVRSGL